MRTASSSTAGILPSTRCKAGEWEWDRLGVSLAVETTGTIKDREGLSRHLDRGAKKVVISAPGKDVDAMIVMGVNHDIYDGGKHKVISAASCTTNCLAPAAKVLHELCGIRHGLMTTIHSYTMSQRILDGSHKDWRRGRAAAVSMVPSSTGAARPWGRCCPELAGKLNGMSVRVPTFDCSLVDLTCEVERPCDAAGRQCRLQGRQRRALGRAFRLFRRAAGFHRLQGQYLWRRAGRPLHPGAGPDHGQAAALVR